MELPSRGCYALAFFIFPIYSPTHSNLSTLMLTEGGDNSDLPFV